MSAVTVTVCTVPAAADVSPDTTKDVFDAGGAACAIGAAATNRVKTVATDPSRPIASRRLRPHPRIGSQRPGSSLAQTAVSFQPKLDRIRRPLLAPRSFADPHFGSARRLCHLSDL